MIPAHEHLKLAWFWSYIIGLFISADAIENT